MKKVIRLWMGGQDFYDPANPECSSFGGILNYRGLAVGFCYRSYVTGRHYQILDGKCPEQIVRYLKGRKYATVPDITITIAVMRIDQAILYRKSHRIRKANTYIKNLEMPLPFRTGDEFLKGCPDADAWLVWADELTVLIYDSQKNKAPLPPYLVTPLCETDKKTIQDGKWRRIDENWVGTKDLTDFIMFKISCIKSIAIEIN